MSNMAINITVPQEYGYVLLTAAATCVVGIWHGMRIGGFRKTSGITYPQHYAEKSDLSAASADKKKQMYLYNCAQRAHGNFNENLPIFLPSLLIAGLRYPVATSIMGAGWVASRIAYAVGYTRADKENGKGRLIGSGFWLFQFGLIGMVGTMGAKMIM